MTKKNPKKSRVKSSHNHSTLKKKTSKKRRRRKKTKTIHFRKKFFKELKILLVAFSVSLTLMAIAIFFTTTFGKMKGYSMIPTINNNDIFSINKVNQIRNFDVVYLKTPSRQTEKSVRRVIGLPGDELSYKNDELTINQEGKAEKYLNGRKNELLGGLLTEDFTLKSLTGKAVVPADCYFVMGDNRQSSADSRDYGFVNKKDIIGKVEVVLFPLSTVKTIR